MSKIEWTGATWNPVFGCTKVSSGCANCYAERMAHRLATGHNHYHMVTRAGKWNGKIICDEDVLLKPLGWRAPRTIFVCSMADLFHEDVPDEFIYEVLSIVYLCPQHTFQVLTKRADRMADISRRIAESKHHDDIHNEVFDAAMAISLEPKDAVWPPRNLWLGTSVESNKYRSRIKDLIQCPAAVRFLSLEPLLGPLPDLLLGSIDQLIIGGESGPGARPCDIEWIRDIVRQGKAAGVPVFVKQLGGHPDKQNDTSKWPEDLRVREFPVTDERREASTK